MSTQPNAQNKHELAYELMKSRILDGTYGAGCRLVIDRLARELGFSTIPVREAIRKLEAEGFVEYERFSGVRVTRIDEHVYVETLSVLAVLEAYATSLACRNLRTQDIAKLRETNQRMAKARADFDLEAYSKLNQDFHRMICEASYQQYLLNQIKCVQERLDAVRSTVFMLIPHRTSDSYVEHEELIKLVEEGAPVEQIETFARTHKMATLESFMRWKAQHP